MQSNDRPPQWQEDVRALLVPAGALLMILLVMWYWRAGVNALVQRPGVSAYDVHVLETFRAHATPGLDAFFTVISWCGSPVALTLIALAGAAVLYRTGPRALFRSWITALGGSSILAVSLKHMYQRQRPPGAEQFLHAVSYGFPSTHSLTSLVGFSMIGMVVLVLGPRSRLDSAAVIVGTVISIAAIGLSRLYLGVHYVSDVLAGFTIGLVWLGVCVATFKAATHTPVSV